jgi:hypothetical protein
MLIIPIISRRPAESNARMREGVIALQALLQFRDLLPTINSDPNLSVSPAARDAATCLQKKPPSGSARPKNRALMAMHSHV